MLIQASRYLGVPPWELEQQPIRWLELAYASKTIDNAAHEAAMTKARKGQ